MTGVPRRMIAAAVTVLAAAGLAGTAQGTAAATPLGTTAPNYVVATNGSDSNPGTLAAPFATLAKAVSAAQPGQKIALRGGVYYPTATTYVTTSGTAGARILISNYGTETPVLDGSKLSSSSWFIHVTASYLTMRGLEIRNVKNKPLIFSSVQKDIVKWMTIHDNQDTGLNFQGDGTKYNVVADNDFYRNHDDATYGQNADGLAFKFGSGNGNVIAGNRMYDNADDGLDLWKFLSPVTIHHNWAYGNGFNRWGLTTWEGNGNGFKLGAGGTSVAHNVYQNAAWGNSTTGFTENGNTGPMTVTNNTSYANYGPSYYFWTSSARLTNNIAINNVGATNVGSAATASNNSWQLSGWNAAVFASRDASIATGARPSTGKLPVSSYLVNTKDASIGASMTD